MILMINDKFIQLSGPFKRSEDVIYKIKKLYPDFRYIKKLGIQTLPSHGCNLNGIVFEIGRTGILEFDNVRITQFHFIQDESAMTLIDCIMG